MTFEVLGDVVAQSNFRIVTICAFGLFFFVVLQVLFRVVFLFEGFFLDFVVGFHSNSLPSWSVLFTPTFGLRFGSKFLGLNAVPLNDELAILFNDNAQLAGIDLDHLPPFLAQRTRTALRAASERCFWVRFFPRLRPPKRPSE